MPRSQRHRSEHGRADRRQDPGFPKPVTIVHIITKLELGGAQQTTLFTVSHLDSSRFRPILITGESGLLDDEARRLPGVEFHQVPALVRPIRPVADLRALYRLTTLLRRLKPLIVHTHSSKAGILGRCAARLAGVPIIIHSIHGFGFTPSQHPLVRRLLIALEWAVGRFTTRFLAVSEANRQTGIALGFFPPERCTVIRSGIDLQAFRHTQVDVEKKRRELELQPEDPIVGMIAPLKPQKGPLDFVRVAALVHRTRPDVKFLLIGDGDLRREVEAAVAREGLEDVFRLLGWRRDIPEVLRCLDVLTLTSHWEGLPRVYLEALASGVPVVGTNVDGASEVIRNGINGYLREPGDIQGIADALLRVLAQPERAREMGRQGQALAEEFDIGEMVRRQEMEYAHLLQGLPALWKLLSWTKENVLPGLLISLALLLLLAGAGEVYVRSQAPFIDVHWPVRFDPRVGFTFIPHASIQWTNHLDFWARDRANAQGFLDREWIPGPLDPQSCRVAFLGDSFVEAAQVRPEERFHIVFERLMSETMRRGPVTARAYGYSGTGQLNQLVFYDEFIRPFRPHVLGLVIVNNDIANNSYLLEAVRNGWEPRHPPRPFAVHQAETGAIGPLPVDPQWGPHQLPPLQGPGTPQAVLKAHTWLHTHSFVYNRLFAHLNQRWPEAASWVRNEVPYTRLLAYRKEQLERKPAYQGMFTGWLYPDDWDMDTVFYAKTLAPIFRQALLYTGYAFDQFQTRSRQDNFRILALTASALSNGGFAQAESAHPGNPLMDRAYYQRIKALLDARGIPVVDQFDHIVRQGSDLRRATFTHDGHWSPQGHQWAAEALATYFSQHPELCGSQSREQSAFRVSR